MSMILTCACGKKLRVPDGATGSARCPACQARIPIPTAADEPEPISPPPRPPSAAAPQPRPRPRSADNDDQPSHKTDGAGNKSGLIALVVGGCSLLLVLGCGGAFGAYYAFFHNRDRETPSTSTDKGGGGGATAGAPREFKGHENMVTTLAFSKDGALLVSGSMDKTLRVWDVATATEKKSVAHPAGFVWNAVWTAEGRVVTTSGDGRDGGGKLSWIDPVTGTIRKDIGVTRGNVRALAVSPDGRRLAWVKGGGVEVIPAGVDAAPGPPMAAGSTLYDTLHLAFTPDGKKVLATSNSNGSEWDPESKAKPRRFKDTVQDTTGVAVAGNGLYAVSTTRGVISMIDPTSLKLVENVRDLPSSGAFGVAVSPDGKVASAMENGVRFFDPKTRAEVGRVSSPAGVKFQATCVALSPDGSKVAAGGGFTVFDNPKNYAVYLWDVAGMALPPKKN